MRTYSHAALGWAAARLAGLSGGRAAAWGAVGGALPDLPAAAGAAWIWRRGYPPDREGLRERVCSRSLFAGPDAALHSALPVGLLALASWSSGRWRGPLPALLTGWAGHVFADALTHAGDARPALWPIPGWRPRSPVSYWDRSHHARAFAVVEHGALLLLAVWAVSRRVRGG